jgi:hypothetical protein
MRYQWFAPKRNNKWYFGIEKSISCATRSGIDMVTDSRCTAIDTLQDWLVYGMGLVILVGVLWGAMWEIPCGWNFQVMGI